MRTLGIDPGTVSFDLCCLDDSGDGIGKIVLDASIASPELGTDPALLIDAVRACMPFDLAVGPAGYGVPLLRGEQIGEHELALMMLVRDDENKKSVGIGGLKSLIRALIATGAPFVFLPGVVHLPTVPAYRKANRIDMGTADKVASVAQAIVEQAQRLQIDYAETSFIMLELGGAFSAAIAVEGGQIIDGCGGSSGPMGFRAGGAMDGEAAYLLGETLSKDTIFSGGARDIAERDTGLLAKKIGFDEWAQHPQLRFGWLAWLESVVKHTFGLTAVLPKPREVLLSGRLSLFPSVEAALTQRLSFAPVHRLMGLRNQHGEYLKSKSAAQGAALIANGVAGGRYRALVDVMELRGARGTVWDHLYLRGAVAVRQAFE